MFLGLTIEHGNFVVKDSGELRRLLISLSQKQDDYSKSMILHSITRCVYLLESEVRAKASWPFQSELLPNLLAAGEREILGRWER